MQPVFEQITTPIGGMEPQDIDFFLGKVTPLLEKVVKPESGYNIGSVLDEIRAGRFQLWVIGDFTAVVITQTLNFPLHDVLYGQALAGSDADIWMNDWLAVQEAYATAKGCKYIDVQARPGFKKFKDHGYKVISHMYRKEL